MEKEETLQKDLNFLHDYAFAHTLHAPGEWKGAEINAAFERLSKALASSAPQNLKDLRQMLDYVHAEVYSVWNGAGDRLNHLELNHLEQALKTLSKLIDAGKVVEEDSEER